MIISHSFFSWVIFWAVIWAISETPRRHSHFIFSSVWLRKKQAFYFASSSLWIAQFKGPKYWSDGNADGEPDQGYTRQIKEIDVELSKVDGAISLPTGNFIFSDDKYWKVQSARSSLQVLLPAVILPYISISWNLWISQTLFYEFPYKRIERA